ncbi:hypothetical protein GGR50DRAFT_79372 [Xylaria sp. CBS 124048]|nr:hypothetical protein GGR50DRAFT_79372 [Xylaria sp. CBS 124048]
MGPYRADSDTASYYTSSAGSVWSATDSASVVYTDNPYWAGPGIEGIRGAVTRADDRRDERRVRLAAHILRGPFAAHKPKKHSSHRYHGDSSDTQSNYSSSSASSSSTRRHEQFSRGSSTVSPPPHHIYPTSPHPQYQHPQHPPPFDTRPHYAPPMGMGMGMGMGPGMGANMGMRPPPPPHLTGQPPHPGFEAGFVQLGVPYDGEPEIWD